MIGPEVPLPTTVKVFRVVAVVRVALVLAGLVAAAVVLPRVFDQATSLAVPRVDGRSAPAPDLSALGPVVAVFTSVLGLVFLVAWAWCASRVPHGVKWAAITTAALSGYTVVSGAFSLGFLLLRSALPVPSVGFPGWYLALVGLGAATDLVVVVLLVLRPTRAFISAHQPVRPPAPVYPGPHQLYGGWPGPAAPPPWPPTGPGRQGPQGPQGPPPGARRH